MRSRILLIYTGGTIGMNRNPRTGALEPFDFEHLAVHVPDLQQFDTQIDTFQFTPPIDSSDMTPARWTDISHCIADRYEQYDGFVVLHGTDTMAYTASALSYMLENLTKPVIFTGSQLPIGQLRTDGKENLITAVEIAAAKDAEGRAMVPEVGICFGGHLLRGNRTTKQSAEEFNAFESFNYPHLVEAGVNITYHRDRILKPDFSKPMKPHFRLDNNVIIFSLFPGIREDLIRHIIHPQPEGHRDAHLRLGQRPAEPLAAQRPARGHEERQGDRQHLAVHAGRRGDEPLRLRLPSAGGGRHQRQGSDRRVGRHQADVPPVALRKRPADRAPADDAEPAG